MTWVRANSSRLPLPARCIDHPYSHANTTEMAMSSHHRMSVVRSGIAVTVRS